MVATDNSHAGVGGVRQSKQACKDLGVLPMVKPWCGRHVPSHCPDLAVHRFSRKSIKEAAALSPCAAVRTVSACKSDDSNSSVELQVGPSTPAGAHPKAGEGAEPPFRGISSLNPPEPQLPHL